MCKRVSTACRLKTKCGKKFGKLKSQSVLGGGISFLYFYTCCIMKISCDIKTFTKKNLFDFIFFEILTLLFQRAWYFRIGFIFFHFQDMQVSEAGVQRRIYNPVKQLWWTFFANRVNSFKLVTISVKNAIKNILKGPKYAFDPRATGKIFKRKSELASSIKQFHWYWL